jgi:LCP family protein required for cell wall assembly
MRTGRVLLALVSLLVFSLTGYAWANYQKFNDLTTADVIDSKANDEHPADGAVDILLVGLDSRKDAQGHPLPQDVLDQLQAGGSDDGGLNTDTLIMMHIPTNGQKAVAISFPRDSYVDIAGGFGKHKINSAYSYGKNAKLDELRKQGVTDESQLDVQSNQAGARNLIETIQNLTGSTIDHYAEINLAGFYEITKAVGGVDVCLLHAVNEPKSGARFSAGQHTVSGREALSFVRQRYDLPRGDLDRIVRQQVFMASMANKMLSGGVLTDMGKLNDLIAAVKKYVVLDKDWDILGFARRMQGLTGGNLTFQTIPTGRPDLPTPEDGEAVEVHPDDVRGYVQGLTSGADPGKPSSAASKSPAVDRGSVTVDVRNASGVRGLASTVLTALVNKGYVKGDYDNAAAMRTSVVRYGPGGEAGAKLAATDLGGLTTEEDANLPSGRVRVFLGSDYSGPGSQGAAGPNALALDGGSPVHQQDSATPTDPPIAANGVKCVN